MDESVGLIQNQKYRQPLILRLKSWDSTLRMNKNDLIGERGRWEGFQRGRMRGGNAVVVNRFKVPLNLANWDLSVKLRNLDFSCRLELTH